MTSHARSRRWMAWLSLSLLSAAPGCATFRSDPNRLLMDNYEPAPLGYHGSGDVARLAPPRAEPCTVATARECYQRGVALATGEDGELDRIRALSLLVKACDGQVREACEFLQQHVTSPRPLKPSSRWDPSVGASMRLSGALVRSLKVKCRLTEGGILRGCVLKETNLTRTDLDRALQDLVSFMDEARYEMPAFDGEPFESNHILVYMAATF